ncbi:TonB-dependent receptor [Bacteroides fragilis]|uniref:TonB-dependent receptor n=1 Tax=Bacteroides fragilis TaxID=817 RepID=UPI0008A423AF|nr:TonB-dependent receptor [Bacteroides fragilis]MCZ2515037.1 TonB-dependent receptor [Bacteroides fragilis]MCZ2681948.1 TonB-dependent receptor [Bacteroides fragilis]WKN02436.1 TonB-dependent receptor [Bacteroides fragilis]
MKMIVLFLFVFISGVFAGNANSQETKVSISKNNKPIREILGEIERQTDYLFVYSEKEVDVNQRKTVNVSQQRVADVLSSLFRSTNVGYAMEGHNIMLMAKTTQTDAAQQKRHITGVVKDIKGETIIGANIMIKGTGTGVSTNIDGKFSIEAAAGEELIVSFIGYLTQTIKIDSQKTLNIKLLEDTKTLEEVVVVGYTVQTKSAVTGSVAVVKADKLKDVNTLEVGSMLQGKVSGVYVSGSSGEPGQASKIRIRGKGTLNSSVSPLWVVDGVIVGEDPGLNPNEIDNISVLKDGSATALYGSRAANGVIVVTTKRGEYDANKYSVSVNAGVSLLSTGRLEMMNSQELYDYQKSWNNQSWFTEELLKHNTDWFKEASKPGLYTNANITYTGSSGRMRSFVMADYYREEGAIKDFTLDRFTFRSNNDVKFTDRFTMSTKISGSLSRTDSQQRSVYNTYLYLPWDFPYNEDGSIRSGQEQDWRGRDGINDMYDLQWNWSRSKKLTVDGTINFNYQITDWLHFESNNYIRYISNRSESYTDKRSRSGQSDKGSLSNSNSLLTKQFTNQMIRFEKSFGKHKVNALGAYEYTRHFYESTSAEGRGIQPGREILDVTTGIKSIGGYKDAIATQSALFNANYDYDNRYMGQVSYRMDESSCFGKNNRMGHFFTVSGGWNIQNETFFESLRESVNQLKVRVSYGSLGNTPGAYYGHYPLYSSMMYNDEVAYFPSQMGNADLSWEKCYTTNIGIDARFFDRFGVTIDLYNKNTSDLLYYAPLPNISGYTGQYKNVGAINNKGLEISLNADVIRTSKFQWTSDFNIGFNRNRVTELYGGKPELKGLKRLEEGRDMDEWYLREWTGVDPANGSPLWYTTDENGKRTTTDSYNKADRVYCGSAAPKFTGGWMNSFSYKGFTLTANFDFVYGNLLYNQSRELLDSDGAYADYNSMKLKSGWKRWEKEGDIATHPKAINGGNKNSNKSSSRYLEKGNYFSLRNLSLGYSIPEKLCGKLGLQRVNVSCSADNLFTLTPFSGVSPQLSDSSTDGYAGTIYPLSRRIVFGLNVSF